MAHLWIINQPAPVLTGVLEPNSKAKRRVWSPGSGEEARQALVKVHVALIDVRHVDDPPKTWSVRRRIVVLG
eukprot:COSAG01_NODE_58768_length_304_cov_0.668293_1_plen_71_part_01